MQHDTPSLSIKVRSALFFVLYNLAGIIYSFFCVIVGFWLPMRPRHRFINQWTHLTMWLDRHLNGVKVQLEGVHNLPDAPCVVLSNHQSSWETFFLQTLICPQTTVVKRELLWIPFFGWGLALLNPIRIDRSKGNAALKSLLKQGKERLQQGLPVVIFPEGTRQPPGTIGRFNHGGTMLACQAGVPVVAISSNSGDCWPKGSWIRYPGTITVRISPPIGTEGKKAQQVTAEVQQWIQEHYPG
ncbi:MAG: 1-acyl-sn-glycerol-3-phosphate acyltransferase [Alcanivoracaceae bacterium]|uniref:lysophospholipid acyltransferase family protein n=1 Tax=Alcanivorax sp. MD8A TaxID=1177157 RepID=UPI000C4D6B9A|nr:lysophospholipid acyltransferase family protein [Alcanivorax sp. MD8A]MAX56101.1 1-acyl-sn-glycerol-3-phosphate acyltransferase [Alcanivoracaceae bacterium]MED5431999.1 lysophospholipid acyltransferase family protein [Pseudomonadota bacterium]MEE2869248.1 lysophospholipid acyltransferase family protein [Pseudomonadota bacterium]PNE03971.1 1-acyl-sn-glycerol-3-phosphate acyltransferase [Alcanivorax sp. MD8A]|tara:strand:+ start:1204 stop:1929 length:726 start_codon:yes stop_codon:yes gene_type:complete